MKQGFTIREIPSHTERVCNGCEFLNTQAGMRGHTSVTNSFSCKHPDIGDFYDHMVGGKAKMIHFNIEGSCITPSWCPFLKPKQNNP